MIIGILIGDISLSAILLVKLIHHRLSRLDDLHAPWRIRMTADRDRIVLHRQMHRASIHRRHRFRPYLLLHMLLHILKFPRSRGTTSRLVLRTPQS